MQFHSQAQDVLINPKVIVEVLSPSTVAVDRGDKLHRYRRLLPTLTDYVLVAQDRLLIDHYQHTPSGQWELETIEGLDAHLHLPSIACTVPLIEVYERIVFPQAEGEPTP
jgi:Uma2 family endonuclease